MTTRHYRRNRFPGYYSPCSPYVTSRLQNPSLTRSILRQVFEQNLAADADQDQPAEDLHLAPAEAFEFVADVDARQRHAKVVATMSVAPSQCFSNYLSMKSERARQPWRPRARPNAGHCPHPSNQSGRKASPPARLNSVYKLVFLFATGPHEGCVIRH